MTHKLNELFNLAPESPDEPEEVEPILSPKEITTSALSTLEKIENSLSEVRGLELVDNELDELADMAKTSYADMMDLGMQTESRFSAEIFNVASSLLGHAISAKTVKLNKKLRMIDLQLKAANLQLKVNAKDEKIEATPLGEVRALDRNELLKMFANDK